MLAGAQGLHKHEQHHQAHVQSSKLRHPLAQLLMLLHPSRLLAVCCLAVSGIALCCTCAVCCPNGWLFQIRMMYAAVAIDLPYLQIGAILPDMLLTTCCLCQAASVMSLVS